jgi:hypothetical protein
MELFFLILSIPALVTLTDLAGFLIAGRQIVSKVIMRPVEVAAMIILPLIYGNFGVENNCCGEDLDTAVFSPEHQLTMGVIIIVCLLAYFYATLRKTIAPPITEILVNALLYIGIILNIFIAIHTKEIWLALGGNMPIIILAVLVLAKNQKIFLEYSRQNDFTPQNKLESMAWHILNMKPILKFPVIFLICLPVLLVVTTFLLLFGQKPDSVIRAFTETYKHGLSQWDYQCENVACGGHYLCSVAAKGHKEIVKPVRLGVRNGGLIICNRQLLISNAFEELIQEKLPYLHKIIRRQYNKVGDLVHRHYHVFDNRFVSDFIYILMKPLEWLFLLVLYIWDKKPENRIASQYLNFVAANKKTNS